MIEMTFFKFKENGKISIGNPIPIVDPNVAVELEQLCKTLGAKELNGDVFLEVLTRRRYNGILFYAA